MGWRPRRRPRPPRWSERPRLRTDPTKCRSFPSRSLGFSASSRGPPMMRTEADRLVFRVEVLGRKPTIEDILGPDYLKGPTPAGSPSHQEFLDLVTPEGVKGYAAFSNKEAFVVAATSFALKWALQRAIHKFETAKAAIDREAARKEVQEALADLDRARARAGLPPR